jgi:hypothetical protein
MWPDCSSPKRLPAPRDAEIDLRRPVGALGLAGLPARGFHRLLEELLVEFYADLADVARLLLAQEVAGAADVEVVAGELEASAERI